MNPRLILQGLGLEFANTLLDSSPSAGNRTPPAVLKPWGWKVQPLQLFSRPGAGKCNPSWCIQGLGAEPRPCDPSCCFQVLGLESATPPTVLKPCGWKLQPVLRGSGGWLGGCEVGEAGGSGWSGGSEVGGREVSLVPRGGSFGSSGAFYRWERGRGPGG